MIQMWPHLDNRFHYLIHYYKGGGPDNDYSMANWKHLVSYDDDEIPGDNIQFVLKKIQSVMLNE